MIFKVLSNKLSHPINIIDSDYDLEISFYPISLSQGYHTSPANNTVLQIPGNIKANNFQLWSAVNIKCSIQYVLYVIINVLSNTQLTLSNLIMTLKYFSISSLLYSFFTIYLLVKLFYKYLITLVSMIPSCGVQ